MRKTRVVAGEGHACAANSEILDFPRLGNKINLGAKTFHGRAGISRLQVQQQGDQHILDGVKKSKLVGWNTDFN